MRTGELMPEGPECLRVATQLHEVVKGKILTGIEILSGRYLKTGQKFPGMGDYLSRERPPIVMSVSIKGKFIYWILTGGHYIFSTLGMTGGYKVTPNDYARVKFTLEDTSVYYCDMRNFGTLKYVTNGRELEKKLEELGPDMMQNPSYEEWRRRLQKRKHYTLVSALMEQKVMSGVGNIYKSESLYVAKLDPRRKVESLTETEYETLFTAIKAVLHTSYVSGGSTIANYSDLFNNEGQYTRYASHPSEIAAARRVLVYNQTTDPEGRRVERLSLDDGRTTYWVPEVQR